MTRAERRANLGEEDMAEIRRRVEAAPIPPRTAIEPLRAMLAPALARLREQRAAERMQREAA